MLKKISFEIETITPMFLSGADQSKAELRAASIKGLLRFWWRALQAESDINKLRERESQIFGSSDVEKGGGSSFSIRVSHDGDIKTTRTTKFLDNPNYKVSVEGKTFKMNILAYLAYGLYDFKKGFLRDYIAHGEKFHIIFNIKREDYLQDIVRTMFVFSLFGGIGSRNRNGFGSFDISNGSESFNTMKDTFVIDNPYKAGNLHKIIKREVPISDYPSFSKGTKIFKAQKSFSSVFDSLADVGKIYRSGRISLENRHQFQKRQFIGAPLDPPKETFESFLERHAKPYFIKIAKEDNSYRSYVLYLPSQYCEGKEREDRKERGEHKIIDHSAVNRQFDAVCTQFNEFLVQHMDTVI